MNHISDNVAERKKAIFDAMSARGQKRVLKRGYEQWDPFAEPKDPIDIRRDPTRRTAHQLLTEFLQSCGRDNISEAYRRGALEVALGIINQEERITGIVEFVDWYQRLLKKEKSPQE